ncbi:hypothetical protein AJ88_20990 [Mesorhizobium amorphae CCBAU 01583]|nr:hypothetical protein AJ88_20990 [Mesorhizobium amorphae CCBAU 01583]
MIVTDKAGNVIGHSSSSALAMRMGGDRTFVQRHSGVGPIKAPEFKAAAFAFFAFKYCGWRQTFERNVGENNGCYQSSQRREYDTFVATLPKALSTLQSTIGERFEILGWQGMKLR